MPEHALGLSRKTTCAGTDQSTGRRATGADASQKTEAEAHGGHQPRRPNANPTNTRRRSSVLILAMGRYYRAMVGRSDSDEAIKFCSNMRIAGGNCVVQGINGVDPSARRLIRHRGEQLEGIHNRSNPR